MFGGEYSGWCCGTCPTAAIDQLGSLWGGVPFGQGLWLTRLPVFITDPNYRLVRNKRASVFIGDVTVDDVAYRPVSVAASQYGDGSWMDSPKQSVVWFQINYAPVADLHTLTPRAGLACVRVADTTKSAQQTDPTSFKAELVWAGLVNDENGDPEYWDARHKLCGWWEDGVPARKTCVGPEHFAFQIRRSSGVGTNKLIVYQPGTTETVIDPEVLTWANPEVGTDTTWRPIYFSSHSFPMALFSRAQTDLGFTYGHGGLRQLTREMRIAPAAGATLVDKPASRVAHQLYSFSSDEFYEIPLSKTAVYIQDLSFRGQMAPSVEAGTPPVPLYIANYPPFFGSTEEQLEGSDYWWACHGWAVHYGDNVAGGFAAGIGADPWGDDPPRIQVQVLSRNQADANNAYVGLKKEGEPHYSTEPDTVEQGPEGLRSFAPLTNGMRIQETAASYFFLDIVPYLGVLRTYGGAVQIVDVGGSSLALQSAGDLAPFPLGVYSSGASVPGGVSSIMLSIAPESRFKTFADGDTQQTHQAFANNFPLGLTPGDYLGADTPTHTMRVSDWVGNPSDPLDDPPTDSVTWNTEEWGEDEATGMVSRSARNWWVGENPSGDYDDPPADPRPGNIIVPPWWKKDDDKLHPNPYIYGTWYEDVAGTPVKRIDGVLAFHGRDDVLQPTHAVASS